MPLLTGETSLRFGSRDACVIRANVDVAWSAWMAMTNAPLPGQGGATTAKPCDEADPANHAETTEKQSAGAAHILAMESARRWDTRRRRSEVGRVG